VKLIQEKIMLEPIGQRSHRDTTLNKSVYEMNQMCSYQQHLQVQFWVLARKKGKAHFNKLRKSSSWRQQKHHTSLKMT